MIASFSAGGLSASAARSQGQRRVPPPQPLLNKLLFYLPFDGSVVNNAPGADANAPAGDYRLSTSVKKYGSGSLVLGNVGATSSKLYVQLPAFNVSVNESAGNDGFTLACWLYITAFDTWGRIFDFGDPSAHTNNFGAAFVNGFPAYFNYSGGLGSDYITNPTLSHNGTKLTAWPTNTWTHFAIVVKYNFANTKNHTATIYINGQVYYVFQNTANKEVVFPATSASANLSRTSNLIGKSNWSGDGVLNGYLDQFAYYARALSASDVALLANTPNPIAA